MGRTDPGPQKYKECNKIDSRFCHKVPLQDKYWTELVLSSESKEIIGGYSSTRRDSITVKYPAGQRTRIVRSKSESDCSVPHYEYYLRHNLYIKSAVEPRNFLTFQTKKVSFRNYTPKILSQEANMGMWI